MKLIRMAAALLAAGMTLTLAACSGGNTQPEPQTSADTEEMSALDAISGLYSLKEFSDEAVTDAQVQTILESGVRAPSARNSQPWHFTVVQDAALGSRLSQQGTEGTAAIVISGVEAPDEGIDVSFDCALATQNMALAARALGLGAHIYTGSVANMDDDMLASLEIPEGYAPVALLLVAYAENEADAVAGASQRNALEDTVNYIG